MPLATSPARDNGLLNECRVATLDRSGGSGRAGTGRRHVAHLSAYRYASFRPAPSAAGSALLTVGGKGDVTMKRAAQMVARGWRERQNLDPASAIVGAWEELRRSSPAAISACRGDRLTSRRRRGATGVIEEPPRNAPAHRPPVAQNPHPRHTQTAQLAAVIRSDPAALTFLTRVSLEQACHSHSRR